MTWMEELLSVYQEENEEYDCCCVQFSHSYKTKTQLTLLCVSDYCQKLVLHRDQSKQISWSYLLQDESKVVVAWNSPWNQSCSVVGSVRQAVDWDFYNVITVTSALISLRTQLHTLAGDSLLWDINPQRLCCMLYLC